MNALRIVKGFNVIKKQRLGMIAIKRDLVVETFALEGRPKNHPLLTQPRKKMRTAPHRNRPKNKS
jgi:hypothetical protein